jgi:hypothetical protein
MAVGAVEARDWSVGECCRIGNELSAKPRWLSGRFAFYD